ncbi:MAG: glycosyltransferase family 4 protein [Anaerolineae bacterium]|jgi:glycosyltransferase involved in cell wall biosynthesis|nr:glycosyltransferase family 4 protein [Anaerolineae bacterium]MDH7474906.1 glycosyltransferase family 4 protein [Anaerolineae bacterium]
MDRIRVARVIARLNIGGPAIHTILLTAGLHPARFESLLVTGVEAEHEGNMLDLAAAKGVQPLIIPDLGREISLWRDVRTLGALYRLFRRWRPTIVHTHTAKAGTVGRLAARLAGVPIVIHTFHGHVFHGYFGSWKTQAFICIERGLARLSDRIVTVSEGQRAELAGYGIAPPDKIVVIPLGFELDELLHCQSYQGALRAELGLAADTPLVGIVARLTAVKNHHLFLEAARLIVQAEPVTRFLIVGDGELRDELENRARELGLAERVFFLGWRSDMPRIYADLDVIALTSRNEGTPVSLIEGMAAGVPVVSTAVGGVPDIVADGVCGYLVPPDDAAGLAEAIVALLRDKKKAQAMGQAGREAARERFGMERLLSDVERLYTQLLIEKGLN